MALTLLHLAAMNNEVDGIIELVKNNVGDIKKPNALGQLPIYLSLLRPPLAETALIKQKEELFRVLWGAAPESLFHQDYEGNTVFHLLASQGYNELLTEVLNTAPQGALIPNHHGEYPIHSAIINNNLSIDAVQTLLKIREVADLKNAEKCLPIHYAALYGDQEIMKACCAVTLDLDVRNIDGKNAYTLAQEVDNQEAMLVLRNHGVSPPTFQF